MLSDDLCWAYNMLSMVEQWEDYKYRSIFVQTKEKNVQNNIICKYVNFLMGYQYIYTIQGVKYGISKHTVVDFN